MDSKEIWTIEYCKRQDQFHIDRLDIIIKRNFKDLLDGKRLEWIIVALAPSAAKAGHLTEKLRKKVRSMKKLV